ncbi:MAG TPA: hypothetical protein VES03_09135 [Motilibacterales bacterium]|nr:hypothetical protein [Motilibacterales bacterium]
MRLLALAAAMVCAVLVLTLGRDLALPWQPGCTVVDSTGAVLAAGSPSEVSTLIDGAGDEVAAALGEGPAVSCRIGAINATDAPKEPPLGLTPAAQALRAQVRSEFGDVPAGGFGPEETLPGRSPGGEHSLGRAVDFFFRPYDDPDRAREGWRLANWAVANAERLGIRTVIYRDRIWTARRSMQGWREYRFRGRDPDNPVNRHLDHVHVDVA